MEVEIWSDIMCPFCYIGKRKFENALSQFADKEDIKVIWKSYQLSPNHVTDLTLNNYQYLANHKGISIEEAKQMSDYVADRAVEVGLKYDFDKVILANSFKAHCLSHLAKKHGFQNEIEEVLFRAYFTEGKNIDDNATLMQLGIEIGLDENEISNVLENGIYGDEVRKDIYEAQQVGVRGVPFFVFDRKYAVSGAQESATFLKTIEKSHSEWRIENPKAKLEVLVGEVCDIDGNCS